MLTKLVALLMTPVLLYFTLWPALAGSRNEQSFSEEDLRQLTSVTDYVNYVQEHGAPSFSTETFFRWLKPADALHRILSGHVFDEKEEAYLDLELSETLSEVCGYIADNTGLDTEAILTHVPNLNGLAEFGATVLHVDTAAFREHIYKLRDQAYSEGKGTLGNVLYLFGAYFSVIEHADVYLTPTAEENVGRITLDITYYDGGTETMSPGMLINTATGLAYNPDDTGMLGLGFNVDIYDLVVYATVHSWQRNLGFMLLYDMLANSGPVFNFVTRRYKFSYAGKDWMIQAWKGNYALVTNGGEVGVYNRAPGRVGTYYDCASDDELMEMSMELYHGDDLLFKKGPMMHWWINGFKISPVIYHPADLTMRYSIVMPDEDMVNAFTAAIDRNPMQDAAYTVDGTTVTVLW